MDALMNQYQMSLSQAYNFPLAAALALWPAMAGRNGWKHEGPDHVAKAGYEARIKMENFLAEKFTIIDTPARRLATP